jgi:pimeloyl-ACP methyl ester carboxylesterase
MSLPDRISISRQPVVIVGGFMTWPGLYHSLQATLNKLTGQSVVVVDIYPWHWIFAIFPSGWKLILNKIKRAVSSKAYQSPTKKVTLIGHSAGGVMSRLFLAGDPFRGTVFNGKEQVNYLITLGSPHSNYIGAWMRKWVEKKYPGAYFSKSVRYVSVAGKAVQGKLDGSLTEKQKFVIYKFLSNQGNEWGDGVVPLSSALLKGASWIILPGVRHFSLIKGKWYGTPQVVKKWWSKCLNESEKNEHRIV